jgi:hypothetical protein
MLHDLLSEHLSAVEAVVRKLKEVYVERYEEEILTDNRVNLRIRVRFKSGYLLELNEANMVEESAIIRLYYRLPVMHPDHPASDACSPPYQTTWQTG